MNMHLKRMLLFIVALFVCLPINASAWHRGPYNACPYAGPGIRYYRPYYYQPRYDGRYWYPRPYYRRYDYGRHWYPQPCYYGNCGYNGYNNWHRNSVDIIYPPGIIQFQGHFNFGR